MEVVLVFIRVVLIFFEVVVLVELRQIYVLVRDHGVFPFDNAPLIANRTIIGQQRAVLLVIHRM